MDAPCFNSNLPFTLVNQITLPNPVIFVQYILTSLSADDAPSKILKFSSPQTLPALNVNLVIVIVAMCPGGAVMDHIHVEF